MGKYPNKKKSKLSHLVLASYRRQNACSQTLHAADTQSPDQITNSNIRHHSLRFPSRSHTSSKEDGHSDNDTPIRQESRSKKELLE
jgi:hypothetical protein